MATLSEPFNFSKMRFTASLQQNNPTSDGSGGQTDNFTTVLTTRVYLEKKSGTENNLSGNVEFFKQYKLMCRFQTGISINADTRWLIGSEVYTISDFERVDMVPHLYTMTITKDQPTYS